MRAPQQVVFIQHQDDCGPGYLGERAEERGAATIVVDALDVGLLDPHRFDLVVPLGSDDAAYDGSLAYLADEQNFLRDAVRADIPVFGVCFGAQLLSLVLGGQVRPATEPEIGWLDVRTDQPDLIEAGPWLIWHLDVMTCPPGGVALAWTDVGLQAFRSGPHLGVQFHPEATPSSARAWAGKYDESLGSLDLDPDLLLEETDRRAPAARQRAHRLFDRAWDRALLADQW